MRFDEYNNYVKEINKKKRRKKNEWHKRGFSTVNGKFAVYPNTENREDRLIDVTST